MVKYNTSKKKNQTLFKKKFLIDQAPIGIMG
jgi:hypothetical protein